MKPKKRVLTDEEIEWLFTHRFSSHNGHKCCRAHGSVYTDDYRVCQGYTKIIDSQPRYIDVCGYACSFIADVVKYKEEVEKLLIYADAIDEVRNRKSKINPTKT